MSTLRLKRKEMGMSMEQLADAAGVTLVSVYRYEVQGRVPDARTAIRLARTLGTTVEELYAEPDLVTAPAGDPDDDDQIPF